MIKRLISGLMLCICVVVGTVTPGVAQYMTSAYFSSTVFSPWTSTLQGSCSQSAPPLAFGSMTNCSEGWYGTSSSSGSTASASCDSNSVEIPGCSAVSVADVDSCGAYYWTGTMAGVNASYGIWTYAFLEWSGGNSISAYVESAVDCDGSGWGYDDSTPNLQSYCPSGNLNAYTA